MASPPTPKPYHTILLLLLAILLGGAAGREQAESGPSDCSGGGGSCRDSAAALTLKLIAILSILAASALGVCLPLCARSVPALKPETAAFSVVKAFASGVILATGYMHVLPDSVECLTSECLPEAPWQKFPFAMFVAMVSAIATLAVDSLSMSFYRRRIADQVAAEANGQLGADGDRDKSLESGREEEKGSELLRYRVVAQVRI